MSYIDNPNLRRQKTIELLSKFKNGEELYSKSPMFNKAIQMMLEGMNEFEVLEEIILANERTQRAFEDYVTTQPHHLYFTDPTKKTSTP